MPTGGLMLNCFVAPLIYHPVERHMLHGPNKMAAKPEARLLLPVPAQRESCIFIILLILTSSSSR